MMIEGKDLDHLIVPPGGVLCLRPREPMSVAAMTNMNKALDYWVKANKPELTIMLIPHAIDIISAEHAPDGI